MVANSPIVSSDVNNFCDRLRKREIVGSFNIAIETILVLRNAISTARWTTHTQLISIIQSISTKLSAAQPVELACANIAGRVLHLIKEEHLAASKDVQVADSKEFKRLKSSIIEGLKDIKDELETCYINIAAQSLEHIHSNEIILTCGKSKTVELFLKEASKRRTFQVIVAETAPFYHGHELAKSLAEAGIKTTLIPDSSVFAIMARVNKVILGAHAVLANGGLVAISGTQIIASAAKYHSTPVVVCTGLYKLSQKYPLSTNTAEFYLPMNPDSCFNYNQLESDLDNEVEIVNPYFDFVAPELIQLFITNVGAHPPSYIYHLINESYNIDE